MKDHAKSLSSEETISDQVSKIQLIDNQFQKMIESPAHALKLLALELLIDGEIRLGKDYLRAALVIDKNIFVNNCLILVNCSKVSDNSRGCHYLDASYNG
jgi:hypothetical protein